MTATPGNTMIARGTARAMTVLGVAYPVAAHLAVLSHNTAFVAASVGMLVVLVLLPALRAPRPFAWGLLLLAAWGLHDATVHGRVMLLVFLPPILINGFMAWLFGHTLRQGRPSFIERIIRALHDDRDDLDAAIIAYARRLTFAWAVLFAALATVNFLLAAFAVPGGFLLAAGIDPPLAVPLGTWSLFANVLNYVIVGAMFAVEYQIRRRRFPQQPYNGFFDFLRRLSGVSAVFRPSGLRQP